MKPNVIAEPLLANGAAQASFALSRNTTSQATAGMFTDQ